MKNTFGWGRFAAVAALLMLLAGCTAVPKQQLDQYISDFATAKSTTQDIILTAKIYAEKSNDGTNVGREKVSQRTRALDARLAAMDLVDQYNNVLVKLATGSDPAAVQGNLESLSKGLNSFGIDRLTSLVSNVAPYLGIISTAVSLIDDAIKAQRFREAAAAAQKPIHEILRILMQDADGLHLIQEELLGRTLRVERNQLLELHFKFGPAVNSLNKDQEIASAVGNYNAALVNWKIASQMKPDPIVHEPQNARPANADDRALLQTMISQVNQRVDILNRISAQIEAHFKVIDEYKKVLDATDKAFENLNDAIKQGQRAATFAFAANVLNLRKAYLELREAK